MEHRFGIKSLIKLVVAVYFGTLLIILIKVHSDTFNEIFNKHELNRRSSLNTTKLVRNITKYIYINDTVIVYKEETVLRYGPGENGTETVLPTNILSKETLNRTETNRKFHGFNTYVSDIVSLHRKVPDMRPQVCKDKVYPDDLPPVSVVIIFRDEWHSILLRTVYSVLETSPSKLIKEVILVDDGSVGEDIRVRVAVHVAAVEKLKLVRNEKPLGLMMARQKGIEAATADYFIVMDGHMEVGPGWLEPLIYRLVQEPNACLCSHIGAILQDNLKYHVDDPSNFNFDSQFPFFDPLTLDQQWAFYRESYRSQRNHSVEPLEYGTIQGMMAAMRKEYFMQLGGFDPGMKVWGTEQMELSIKVWLCGGRVEMIPCSKMAHMYRITPWGKTNASSDHGAANKRRTIEVWMDEPYKSFVMDYINKSKYDYGNLDARHQIRIDNNCKPYKYFVEKVKELTDIFFPTTLKARGQVFSRYVKQCLDLAQKPNKTEEFNLILYNCHGNANQNLILTETSQIRAAHGLILQAVTNGNSTEVNVLKSPSNYYGKESYWEYRQDSTVYNKATQTCLTALSYGTVGLRNCTAMFNQVWEWDRKEI